MRFLGSTCEGGDPPAVGSAVKFAWSVRKVDEVIALLRLWNGSDRRGLARQRRKDGAVTRFCKMSQRTIHSHRIAGAEMDTVGDIDILKALEIDQGLFFNIISIAKEVPLYCMIFP